MQHKNTNTARESSTVRQTVLGLLRALRLALPKIGVGWMFALLTIDFNRIAIVEFGVTAVVVTTMLSIHYFLSPFQVIVGGIADRFPILGYRRTPYMLAGGVLASLVFITLPDVAAAMGGGSLPAFVTGFLLFALFGIAMAMLGDSYHALIAEVTDSRTRSSVISIVWIVAILSTILAAVVMNAVRPEFSPEAMQRLYNLTPPIVIGSILLGVLGIEKRLQGKELEAAQLASRAVSPPGNPLSAALGLLQENAQTRRFFAFIFVAIFAIFLQDNILEVFGAEVFGMTVVETTRFQPTWGAGVLLGMVVTGMLSSMLAISKKKLALIGCVGTAVGMLALAGASLVEQAGWIRPTLFAMGVFTGLFNVGALAMMMDMTVEGATGLYMGLWGVAQAFGTGLSSMASGALHTTAVASGLLPPNSAYAFIFVAEAAGLILAALLLNRVSIARFHRQHDISLSHGDVRRAMEAGSAA